MIAAGICLMGGCFAQDNDGKAVDTYWPSISAAIPSSPESIAILQYDVVQAGAEPDDFFARIKQFVKSGNASFFYVLQFGATAYNCYYGGISIGLESNTSNTVYQYDNPPLFLNLAIDADGARIQDFDMAVPACKWDSTSAGERLRIIDARNGEKDFFHSYGRWGRKWFVLPMHAVTNSEAVFDFEEKVLVEL